MAMQHTRDHNTIELSPLPFAEVDEKKEQDNAISVNVPSATSHEHTPFSLYTWLVFYFKCTGLVDISARHPFVKHIVHASCYCFLLAGCVSSWFLGGQQDTSLLIMWFSYYICMLIVFTCIRKHFAHCNTTDAKKSQSSMSCNETLFTSKHLSSLSQSAVRRCVYVIASFVLYSGFAFYYTFTERTAYTGAFGAVDSILLRLAIGCSWFYYFNVCGAIYIYMMCCCMILKSQISTWIDTKMEHKFLQLKMNNMVHMYKLDSFFTNYDIHVDRCNRFFETFNMYILIGLLMISFRIPLSIVYIFVNKIVFEVPTLVFQCSNWFLFIYTLCELNEQNNEIIKELHRHRVFDFSMIEEIQTYNQYHPLGASIFGLAPSFSLLTKSGVVLFNGILPVLIATVKSLS